MIDETSKIDPKADISSDAVIGPWCVIGPNVSIGSGTVIESSVIIRSNTKIGSNNRIFQFSSVGEDPADKKFTGEETWLEIGDNNIFREGVTLHRGTGSGGCFTKIGSDNLMMPYVHVAHDCIVGDNTVFANNVAISGHVVVGDWVILGGYAGVNQFLKIGDHAMIGAMSHITNDIPAYVIVSGRPASVRSINAIGLERRGFDKETVADIREAFKIIYKRNYSLQEAIDQLKAMSENCKALEILISSLESSEKGIHR
ncbi:MAG: acyl-ACP--UDP-N-acetylglucosamine O-acyltransferase [Gammaproteobacteria bacterium]|nr:acyl-ACP--UDP-N-acetylglucosamine O-acyltransferase [Gammaproteobacteria bacterium]